MLGPVDGTAWVELVFMMVILKLPIIYVCVVIWWALRSDDRPLEGAALPLDPEGAPLAAGRRDGLRVGPRRGGPHGRPVRSYPRTAGARARVER
jgi:hypothetical protein